MKVANLEKMQDLLPDKRGMKTTDQLAVTQEQFAKECFQKTVTIITQQLLLFQTLDAQNLYMVVIIEQLNYGTIQK